MSVDAQRAFIGRSYGPAILARLASVEGVTLHEQEAGLLDTVLVAALDHAGLDASMIELFHAVGGVPWRRCRVVANATGIPTTEAPPEPGAPAEHAREAVVLTVDGPPDRQAWATRALLAALQGVHRHLEADAAFRRPAARPILAGVSDDERHLVLRADPPTTRALLAMSPAELRTVSGLPVRSVTGGRTDPRQHRPIVLGLTLCALLLLTSLVGKQWQLNTVTDALHTSRNAQVTLSSVAPPVDAVPGTVATDVPLSGAPAQLEADPEPAPAPDPEQGAAPVPGAATPDAHDAARPPLDPRWVADLRTRLEGSGVTIDASTQTVTVAFSDDLLAFDPGEATVAESATRPIREFARFLLAHPDLRVWVEGHTDDAAYSNGNWLLGAQRALAVVDHLTKAGVSPRRVILTSHGEHRPVAPNTTAAGRRKNRRVELVLARDRPR